jgi:hypothetical protein
VFSSITGKKWPVAVELNNAEMAVTGKLLSAVRLFVEEIYIYIYIYISCLMSYTIWPSRAVGHSELKHTFSQWIFGYLRNN